MCVGANSNVAYLLFSMELNTKIGMLPIKVTFSMFLIVGMNFFMALSLFLSANFHHGIINMTYSKMTLPLHVMPAKTILFILI